MASEAPTISTSVHGVWGRLIGGTAEVRKDTKYTVARLTLATCARTHDAQRAD